MVFVNYFVSAWGIEKITLLCTPSFHLYIFLLKNNEGLLQKPQFGLSTMYPSVFHGLDSSSHIAK